MKKHLFLLVAILLVYSCKNGQKSNQTSNGATADTIAVEADVYRGPVTIHLDDKLVPLYDTLRMGEMIKSVRYIPLESSDNALIDAVWVRKMGDIYCVVSGFPNSIMKLFDAKGNYIRDPFIIGRARNEISNISNYTVDVPGREVVAISIGTDKYVFFNLDSLNYRVIYNKDYSIPRFYPLGNGRYAALPKNNRAVYGATIDEVYDSLPHILFCDSVLDVTGTAGDGAKPYRNLESTTYPYLSTSMLESGDGVIYRYVNSDTVFTVDADEQMVPAIILDIPDKLKPTMKQSETDPLSRKEQMIYVNQFQLSKDYVFIDYYNKGILHSGIWSRDTGQLLFLNVFQYGMNPIFISDEGHSVQLNVRYLNRRDNVIITPVAASFLAGRVDGVKDDDNPVIMEIILRSGR